MSQPAKPIKAKRCKACKQLFTPTKPMQKVCCLGCAFDLVRINREKMQGKEIAERRKAERSKTKARLVELQPLSYWWKRARKVFNAWVRWRDEGKECISCPTILTKTGRVGGDYDAGHFRGVGKAKHLEFDERNVHGQCKHCNRHSQGAAGPYREKLIGRIGVNEVEALEADNEPRRYRKDEYQAIEADYKGRVK